MLKRGGGDNNNMFILIINHWIVWLKQHFTGAELKPTQGFDPLTGVSFSGSEEYVYIYTHTHKQEQDQHENSRERHHHCPLNESSFRPLRIFRQHRTAPALTLEKRSALLTKQPDISHQPPLWPTGSVSQDFTHRGFVLWFLAELCITAHVGRSALEVVDNGNARNYFY